LLDDDLNALLDLLQHAMDIVGQFGSVMRTVVMSWII